MGLPNSYAARSYPQTREISRDTDMNRDLNLSHFHLLRLQEKVDKLESRNRELEAKIDQLIALHQDDGR